MASAAVVSIDGFWTTIASISEPASLTSVFFL